MICPKDAGYMSLRNMPLEYDINAQEKIEDKLGRSLSDLRKIRQYLSLKNAVFNPEYLGTNFSQIYQRCQYFEEEIHQFNLAEQMMKKMMDIECLEVIAKLSGAKRIHSQAGKMLSFYEVLTNYVLPINILWGMEERSYHQGDFTDEQAEAYKYFKMLANWFMEETKVFDKYFDKLKDIDKTDLQSKVNIENKGKGKE